MAEVWYADDEAGRARSVQCEEPGYPNHDAEGRVMYENTHFSTAEAAWGRVLCEAAAGLKLSVGELDRARLQVTEAERRVVRDATRRVTAERAYADWKAARELGEVGLG